MALRTREFAEAVLEPGNSDDGRLAQLELGVMNSVPFATSVAAKVKIVLPVER